MSHLLIICPLKKELSFLVEGLALQDWKLESKLSPKLTMFHEKAKMVTLAVGGHGKVQFGIQTQHLLSNLIGISKVICLGAGGGLAEDLRVGDLVIAEKTVEHDYTEKFNPKAKLPQFLAHTELLQSANAVNGYTGYKICFGSIASGDEDIIDPIRANELYQKTKAIAVAWEGSGGARACAFNNIPFLELRAITDNARDSVSESFAKNLQLCMHNAADFIHRFLLI